MVWMAVSKTVHRSTFYTPSLRSVVLPWKSGSAAKHSRVCKAPEWNCSLLLRPADKDRVFGEVTHGVTRLTQYNGSSCHVAVKESKWNDLYEVKKEAGVIAELQCQHHANLPFLLGIGTREKPYLIVTQFYGGGSKSSSLNKAIENEIIDKWSGKIFLISCWRSPVRTWSLPIRLSAIMNRKCKERHCCC